eukprot:g14093.t1
MKSFPFDKLRLDFLVILSGEKRVETADKVCFYWGAPESKFQNCSVVAPTTAAEFDLVGVSYAKGVHVSVGTGLKYEDVCFSLHFSRVVVYYIHKGVFPLSACIFFGYSAFAITPEELGGRLQLLVAVFLTCFAIQWIITERLPRVPYLTILDHIVFASVVSLCVTACGMCVAYGIGAGRHFTREHAGGSLEQFDMETARLIDLCVAGALFLLQAAWALSIFVLRIQGGLRNFLATIFPACCVPGILAGLRFCSTGMWGLVRALGFLLWSGPRQMCRALFSLLMCGTSCCDRSSVGKGNKSAGRGGGRSVGPMLGRAYAGAGAGGAGSGAELKRLLEDEDMHASATFSSTSSPSDKEKDNSSNKEEMKMKQLTRFGTRTWASGETIKHQFIVPQTFQAFHMVRRADGKRKRVIFAQYAKTELVAAHAAMKYLASKSSEYVVQFVTPIGCLVVAKGGDDHDNDSGRVFYVEDEPAARIIIDLAPPVEHLRELAEAGVEIVPVRPCEYLEYGAEEVFLPPGASFFMDSAESDID